MGGPPTLGALFRTSLRLPEASWAGVGGVFVVVLCAEPATVLWIVRVESEFDEFGAGVWVVVGYGCPLHAAGDDADWVAGEHCVTEASVPGGVVHPVVYPLGPGFPGVGGASSARSVEELWASCDVAHLEH